MQTCKTKNEQNILDEPKLKKRKLIETKNEQMFLQGPKFKKYKLTGTKNIFKPTNNYDRNDDLFSYWLLSYADVC